MGDATEPEDGTSHFSSPMGETSTSSLTAMLTGSSIAPSLTSVLTESSLAPTMTAAVNFTASTLAASGQEDEGHHYPANMLGFTAACAFIIAILGTFGNLLTIIALPMTKNLRTTATAFVVNLAVVELMFCVFILPMSGAQYLYLQRHLDGSSLLTDSHCIFFVSLRYSITQVELQTILAIALTRALAVSVPRFYQTINQPTVIGVYITVIWLYSIAMRIPAAIGVMGQYEYNAATMECDLGKADMTARFVYLIVDAFIPVLLIFVLYFFVFIMVVRRAMIRQRKFSTNFPPPPTQVKMSSARVARASGKSRPKVAPPTSSGTSASSTAGTGNQRKGSSSSIKNLRTSFRRRFFRAARLLTGKCSRQSSTTSQRLVTTRRDMRVARTIFIIFLLVLVCSVPVAVVHAIDRNVEKPIRFLLVHILYWLQYCLNVLVYVLMNRQYRDAYVDCLARVFPRFKRHRGLRFFWEKASISSRPQPNLTSTKPNNPGNDSCASEQDMAVSGHPMPGGQGRLTAIPEGHSSSAANDSVFSDPQKKSPEEPLMDEHKTEENKYEADSDREDDEETGQKGQAEGKNEEDTLLDRGHWLTQNGTTMSQPGSESMV